MILFDLNCAKGHLFEAWFRDGASFELQRKSRKVQCPACGASTVNKALMAPKLVRGDAGREPREAAQKPARAPHPAMLRALREHIERNCDDVGERFAEEARKVHYGEAEPRSIYGRATSEESSVASQVRKVSTMAPR